MLFTDCIDWNMLQITHWLKHVTDYTDWNALHITLIKTCYALIGTLQITLIETCYRLHWLEHVTGYIDFGTCYRLQITLIETCYRLHWLKYVTNYIDWNVTNYIDWNMFCCSQIPLVPLLPALSMFLNIALMMSLSYITWIRLGIWMAIGKSDQYFMVKNIFLFHLKPHCSTNNNIRTLSL